MRLRWHPSLLETFAAIAHLNKRTVMRSILQSKLLESDPAAAADTVLLLSRMLELRAILTRVACVSKESRADRGCSGQIM